MILQGAGAIIGATTSILSAREHNKALTRQAQAEADMLTGGYLDERQQRAERFAELRSRLTGFQAGGSQLGSASLNFDEMASSAAGDAAVDVGIIDREYRYRMDSISESVKQQSQNVIFAGIKGAMEGFSMGNSLSGSLETLFPAKPDQFLQKGGFLDKPGNLFRLAPAR